MFLIYKKFYLCFETFDFETFLCLQFLEISEIIFFWISMTLLRRVTLLFLLSRYMNKSCVLFFPIFLGFQIFYAVLKSKLIDDPTSWFNFNCVRFLNFIFSKISFFKILKKFLSIKKFLLTVWLTARSWLNFPNFCTITSPLRMPYNNYVGELNATKCDNA